MREQNEWAFKHLGKIRRFFLWSALETTLTRNTIDVKIIGELKNVNFRKTLFTQKF